MAILLWLIALLVWAIAIAASAAAVVNLPLSLPYKILLLLIAWWGYVVAVHLSTISERLWKLEYWTRLVFITVHLRNEMDGIEPATKRLKSDLQEEKEMDEFKNSLSGLGTYKNAAVIIGFIAVAITLGIILDHGLLGPVGEDWVQFLIDRN